MANENENIENIETPEVNKEIEKLKKMLSDANSEAAKYKKELRAKQTADEQAEAEKQETMKALESELNELRKEKVVSEYTANTMKLGYSKENATELAKALADGDVNTVFASLEKHIEGIKKSVLTDAMDNQGGLTKGQQTPSQKQYTIDDIKNMSQEEVNANYDAIMKSLKK